MWPDKTGVPQVWTLAELQNMSLINIFFLLAVIKGIRQETMSEICGIQSESGLSYFMSFLSNKFITLITVAFDSLRYACGLCDTMLQKREPDDQNVRIALACYALSRCCDLFHRQPILF